MIPEFFLNIIFKFITGIFDLLPDVSWNVSSGAFSTFTDCVRSAAYFLPMQTVRTIVGIIIAFGIFRIVIRLLRTLWDILPVV